VLYFLFSRHFVFCPGTEEGFTDDPSVFYGSSHGKDHYPGTGRDPTPFIGERAKREVDRRIVNRLLTPGPESRPEFFVKWREILDEMERFQPQLVIMSTGAFDICAISARSCSMLSP
jgi:acetoin utilization deacetylase AcuC-like enzyme